MGHPFQNKVSHFLYLGLCIFSFACGGSKTAPQDDLPLEFDTNQSSDKGPSADTQLDSVDSGSAPADLVKSDTGSSDIASDSGVETEELFQQWLAFAEGYMAASDIPGAGLVVVLNGTQIHSAGLGVKATSTGDLVTGETPFLTMSLTKMFVAATGLSLVDDGIMDLHAPITDHVPYLKVEAPYEASKWTLHHLLTHTGGLPTVFMKNAADYAPPDDPASLSTLFEEITLDVWAPPGAVWYYSNFGFTTASLVIEEASETWFAETLEQRILEPAGMAHSTMSHTKAAELGAASGHTRYAGEDHILYPQFWPPHVVYMAQRDLWASASDLGKWSHLLLSGGGDVLSSDRVEEMLSPQANTHQTSGAHYGYGVYNGSFRGTTSISHSGSGSGFLAHWMMLPEQGFAAAVLVNSDQDYKAPKLLVEKAADLFLDLPAETAPPDLPAQANDVYEGSYVDSHMLGTLNVYTLGDQLYVNLINWDHTTLLFHLGGDSFAFMMPQQLKELLGYPYPSMNLTFFFDDDTGVGYIVSLYGVAIRP